MSRLSAILPTILLPLVLAACFPNPDYTDLPNVYSIPRTVEVLDNVAVADLAAPSDAERAAVAAALARGGENGLRVKVLLPQGRVNPAEPDVRARVAALGIDPAIAVLQNQSSPRGTILQFLRVTVSAPDCAAMITPNETTEAMFRPNMSFGCATYSNLSRMVTDPADLVRGRTYGGEGGVPAAQGVDRYNQGKVTPLRRTTTVGSIGGGGSSQ